MPPSAESFDIDASSGQLQTKAALDHETRASYTVTVSVRDSKDENSDANEVTDDTIRVTILVADINEAPVFPTSETGMRSVDENTAAGVNIGAAVGADDDDSDTLTYSLDVASRATFDIVATTGQLQTKAALDYETGSTSYSVTVTAADPSGADDTITVTITVNNVDEAGTVTLSSTQPVVGIQLTAEVTDPDSMVSNVSWTWEGSQNGRSWTLVHGTVGFTSSTYTPSELIVGRSLRARATYTDDYGSGKSAQMVFANRVQPALVGPNEPPVFPSPVGPGPQRGREHGPGVNIGAAVAATDPDSDTLTYSLDAPSRDTFDIVATTGQLQTKAALDYEKREQPLHRDCHRHRHGRRQRHRSASPSPSTTSTNPAR